MKNAKRRLGVLIVQAIGRGLHEYTKRAPVLADLREVAGSLKTIGSNLGRTLLLR